MKELYEQLGISSQVYDFGAEIEESLKERFEQFDKTAEYNQLKVLMNHADSQIERISGGLDNFFFSIDIDLSLIREVNTCQHIHQSRLTTAVLS